MAPALRQKTMYETRAFTDDVDDYDLIYVELPAHLSHRRASCFTVFPNETGDAMWKMISLAELFQGYLVYSKEAKLPEWYSTPGRRS